MGDPTTGVPAPQRRAWRRLLVPVLLALLFGGVLGLGAFTTSYAEAPSYLSDDPAACHNCHVMDDVYEAYLRGPHHAVAVCNDCHVPRAMPEHYIVKAIDGVRHSVAFTLANFAEPIRIGGFDKSIALASCTSCHGDFVSMLDHQGQTELEDCTRCHAIVGHDENGAGKP